MDIAFFPGCMVDMLYPEVGIAAVHVLERLGCKVTMPDEQICCGQALINSGYPEKLIPVAKQMIDAYSKKEYKTIVSLTGSCLNAVVNDYRPLLANDAEYSEKLAALSEKFFEFSDFLVNKLRVTNVGARLNAKVTYHKSCHLTRFLGIEEEPLKLLKAVDGVEYVEMEHAERCCGFGGTFSVKEPEISGAMVDEKCQTIIKTGADIVCGADVPCLVNIKGRLDRLRDEGKLKREIKVMHIAQILDSH